MGGGISRQLR
ncbi:hypothetical protein VCEM1676A_002644A, partial [Vibrio cholerae O1 str. EM-1676A]